jgi:predicted MFS family arabinose efflux permease
VRFVEYFAFINVHAYFCQHYFILFCLRFVKGSPHSVFLAFSQSYIKHDLRKNKIVVMFFY